MDKILVTHLPGAADNHKNLHPGYEAYRQNLVPRGEGHSCIIAVHTVPPGKAYCPYHWHTLNEEAFYILSGSAMLRTPDGEQPLSPGDFAFFPTGEAGAHKISNPSDTDPLVYIDFDTQFKGDVCIYPDSGKINTHFSGGGGIFRQRDAVDYYDGE